MDDLNFFDIKAAAMLALTCVVITGCANSRGSSVDRISGMSMEDLASLSVSQKALLAPRLQTAYQRAPGKLKTGIVYSEYLQENGYYQQANQVMQEVAARNPKSSDALLYYAETQASLGYYSNALQTIRQAEKLTPRDWRTYSQEGLILDQIGKPIDARMRYREALKRSPGNPDVLSNIAVSYVLTHNLDVAETYLRRAMANPRPGYGADVRLNLALVVALKGNRSEAEQIATSGVSAVEAKNNLAALDAATAPGGAWEKYAANR